MNSEIEFIPISRERVVRADEMKCGEQGVIVSRASNGSTARSGEAVIKTDEDTMLVASGEQTGVLISCRDYFVRPTNFRLIEIE